MLCAPDVEVMQVFGDLVEPSGADFQKKVSRLLREATEGVVIDLTRCGRLSEWYIGQLVYLAVGARVRQRSLTVRVIERTQPHEALLRARLPHLLQIDTMPEPVR